MFFRKFNGSFFIKTFIIEARIVKTKHIPLEAIIAGVLFCVSDDKHGVNGLKG